MANCILKDYHFLELQAKRCLLQEEHKTEPYVTGGIKSTVQISKNCQNARYRLKFVLQFVAEESNKATDKDCEISCLIEASVTDASGIPSEAASDSDAYWDSLLLILYGFAIQKSNQLAHDLSLPEFAIPVDLMMPEERRIRIKQKTDATTVQG